MNITRKIHLTGFGRHEPIACMVEMDIDVEGLLGEKAFRNKTRRSKAQHGLIKVAVRPVLYPQASKR